MIATDNPRCIQCGKPIDWTGTPMREPKVCCRCFTKNLYHLLFHWQYRLPEDIVLYRAERVRARRKWQEKGGFYRER